MTLYIDSTAVWIASAFSPAIARCVKRLFATLVGVFLQEGFSDSGFRARIVYWRDSETVSISPACFCGLSETCARKSLQAYETPLALRGRGSWCCGCPPGDCVIHLVSGIAVIRPLNQESQRPRSDFAGVRCAQKRD